jgi:tetratricopeptide (TPR) repeat protein
MPFGKKPDAAGVIVDFDAVYKDLIAPAIAEAGMEPLRADEEMTGGIIHKPMFERLILCEYAVADLTTANANVFYELGLRHAVRPWSTVLIYSKGGSQLPFDVAPLRAMPYQLGANGAPLDVEAPKRALAQRLAEARKLAMDKPAADSPIYQLVEDYPNVAHEKTDVFREQVRYSAEKKEKLALARKEGLDAVRALEHEFEPIGDLESGVVIDLFLSYRAVEGWEEMVAVVKKMPRPLAATVMVQEQLALALNRLQRRDEAERILKDLLDNRGPSSETYGLLGRVYKDLWEDALKRKERATARGLLDKAIAAYLKGFETDWRDAYPGVNAVTLMELKEPPDSRREKLVTVVAYAVERRVSAGQPDYWDYATLLELAVLARDEEKALDALGSALASVREKWEPKTTLRNLRLIREARERRQETIPDWMKEVEAELEKATL